MDVQEYNSFDFDNLNSIDVTIGELYKLNNDNEGFEFIIYVAGDNHDDIGYFLYMPGIRPGITNSRTFSVDLQGST